MDGAMLFDDCVLLNPPDRNRRIRPALMGEVIPCETLQGSHRLRLAYKRDSIYPAGCRGILPVVKELRDYYPQKNRRLWTVLVTGS